MTLRQHVMSGLRWTAMSRGISQALSWVGTILVIRLLSPADYGIIAIGGFFILYLIMLSEGGLSDALVRSGELSEQVLKEVQGILFVVNLLCCLALFASAPIISSYFNEPRLREVLPVLSTQFLLMSVSIIPQAQLTRQMRFKELSSISLVQALFTTVVTFVCAYAGWGVWSLVTSNLAGQALKSTMLIWTTREFHVPTLKIREARRFMGFGGYVLLDRTVWHFFANVDSLIVGKALGTMATGLYAVAQNLASLPVTKVAGILAQVALPAFSRIQEDRPKVLGAYAMAMGLIGIYAFPVGFGLAATAGPVVELVLGPKWLQVTPALGILALAVPFRLLSSFDSPLLLALGLPQVMLQNRLISLVMLVSGLALSLRWGVTGVACAWAITAPFIWIVTCKRFCVRLGWPLATIVRSIVAPLLCSTVMLMAVWLVARTLESMQVPTVPRLFALVAVGAVVYSSAMLLTARDATAEAWGMLRGAFRRAPAS